MNTNILVTASSLSDHDLLARLEGLAGDERETSAELVAHLAALDSRPALFAAQGYGSLFSYCTQALRLSEDAACNRIAAARACRRFPFILELLAAGSLSLTSLRLLARYLTVENHESVLGKARDRTRREIEALVAEVAPRPDIPSAVRKLRCPTKILAPLSGAGPAAWPGAGPAEWSGPGPAPSVQPRPTPAAAPGVAQLPVPGLHPSAEPGPAMIPSMALIPVCSVPFLAGTATTSSSSVVPATHRPIVRASAPGRYRVQFTIGQETHEKLRRLQALLRREIPDGDPGAIFDRALTVLLEKVEKAKLAALAKPRPNRSIRPGTDRKVRTGGRPSRHVPREVKREVWERDAGQCAFVSASERRCTERTFLEFHHIQPHARQGPATVDNISLRCWRHNQHEAELIFGTHGPSIVREASKSLGTAGSEPTRTIDL